MSPNLGTEEKKKMMNKNLQENVYMKEENIRVDLKEF